MHELRHVLTQTCFFNLDKDAILAWFPAEFLEEAITWLEAEAETMIRDPGITPNLPRALSN
jgi:hypothetical protein